MEQLPVFTDGANIQAPSTQSSSSGQSSDVRGSTNPNSTVFSEIANKLIAESNQSVKSKMGLKLALSKINQELTQSQSEISDSDLPQDGNIIPYGNDAIELVPIINQETNIKINSTLPPVDTQVRIQQALLGAKQNNVKLDSMTPEMKGNNGGEVASNKLVIDFDNVNLNQKQNNLMQETTRNFTQSMQIQQQQKNVLNENMLANNLGEALKRLVKNNNSSSPSSVSKVQKPTAIEQLQSLNNIGSLSRPESQQINPVISVPKIQQTINHPEWGKELASRIVFISKHNMGEAKIRINPANLGPIELKVSIQNDQASVSFISNHAQVRDAIESSVPRLKEMFEENGFSSLDVDISNSSKSDENDKEKVNNAEVDEIDLELEQLEDGITENYIQQGSSLSLIDFFA